MGKSTLLTYILWLIGGWFGLHHFYLRRDRHALIWFTTFGGCFGLGWFRDLWKIPEYVRDSNEEQNHMEMLTLQMRHSPSGARFSWIRFLGGYIVGYTYGALFSSCLPVELVPVEYLVPVLPFVVAIGVNLVTGVGREKGSVLWACIGSYAAIPWMRSDPSKLGTAAIFSAALMQIKGKSWRRTSSNSHICKRLFVLTLCCSLFCSMCFSSLYFNTYVHTKDGERVRLRDALGNFLNSPAWTETKQAFRDLFNYYQEHGWEKMYQELGKKLDPEGEDHAYKVLGVASNASEDEINKAYRSLVKQWHPDKVKDPARKDEAAETFMKIQKAYETLSKIRSRRSKRGSKNR